MTTNKETTTVAFRVDLEMYAIIQHTVTKQNLRRPSDALRMLIEHAVSNLGLDISYREELKKQEVAAKRAAKKAANIPAVVNVNA